MHFIFSVGSIYIFLWYIGYFLSIHNICITDNVKLLKRFSLSFCTISHDFISNRVSAFSLHERAAAATVACVVWGGSVGSPGPIAHRKLAQP